jgi:hypothetical protein
MLTLQQKYDYAINALQAIAQRSLSDPKDPSYHNEWTEAAAAQDMRSAARRTLKFLKERYVMKNKEEKDGKI